MDNKIGLSGVWNWNSWHQNTTAPSAAPGAPHPSPSLLLFLDMLQSLNFFLVLKDPKLDKALPWSWLTQARCHWPPGHSWHMLSHCQPAPPSIFLPGHFPATLPQGFRLSLCWCKLGLGHYILCSIRLGTSQQLLKCWFRHVGEAFCCAENMDFFFKRLCFIILGLFACFITSLLGRVKPTLCCPLYFCKFLHCHNLQGLCFHHSIQMVNFVIVVELAEAE